MASEIMGLPPFHGYLKFGNLVVRLKGDILDLPEREPDFVPRPRPTGATPAPSVNTDPSTSNPPPSARTSIPAILPAISAPSASTSAVPDRYWD